MVSVFPRVSAALLLVVLLCEFLDLSNAEIDHPLDNARVSKESKRARSRSVLIRIRNHLDQSIREEGSYLRHGKTRLKPPSKIRARTEEMCQFERTGLTGTSGVITYSIDGSDPATFAIVFSVPRSALSGSNWYGIAFVEKNKYIGQSMWNDFSSYKAFENPKSDQKFAYASTGQPVIVTYKDYIITAKMDNGNRAILEVDVRKSKEAKKALEGVLQK